MKINLICILIFCFVICGCCNKQPQLSETYYKAANIMAETSHSACEEYSYAMKDGILTMSEYEEIYKIWETEQSNLN